LSGGASVSSLDGSIDGGVSDAPAGDALAFDAGNSGDGAICSGFCDNFDDRTSGLGPWDSFAQLGNGVLTDMTISSDQFVSAPNSLHVHMPARVSGNADGVTISKQLPLVAGKMSIDLDVKVVGGTPGSGYANLMVLSLNDGYEGSLTTASGGTAMLMDLWVNFEDGGHIQPLFPVGAADENWHHVHYAAFYDPANGSLIATWDDAGVADLTGTTTYGTPPVPGVFTLTLGYADYPSLPAMDIYFDNVQVQ
jgi:hypothetical protein